MGKSLSGLEMLLLIHLLLQFNGRNNGNLTPAYSLMKECGWTSTGSLYKARQGLEHKGFIVVTKQGRKIKGDCTLVAITWNGIDDPIKWLYDEKVNVSPVPLNYFLKAKEDWSIQPVSKHPQSSRY